MLLTESLQILYSASAHGFVNVDLSCLLYCVNSHGVLAFCQLFVRCHFLPQATGHRTRKQVRCSFLESLDVCLPVTLVTKLCRPCFKFTLRFLLYLVGFCRGFHSFILLFLFSRNRSLCRCLALLSPTFCRALNR